MDPREPLKLNMGSGTGIGTLMPTFPQSTSFWNFRAAAPDFVKRAAPLPYGLALVKAMASSSDSANKTLNTGANSSFSYAGFPLCTFVSKVGPKKLPPRYFSSTLTPLPSSSITAPPRPPNSIKASARARASGEMRGPTSVSASNPPPTLSFLALSTNAGTQLCASPTRITTLSAMHRCPAAPNAAPTRAFKAASWSASGSTVAWFLAPRFA
mmetsp:Transcript_3812/g.9018  ORF Transcript_3812/g.9018 Transcript_3812/m.9018 type:complete len:212 (-) Transcript_3812:1100-1735(-)